ncbi:MAG: hypothetical protein LBT89_05640 [Planctomycetaceae bacterium]|jgi:hypothetical protein|nr:hypothetical protein [Planctomycetaceae bacterium]
MATYVTDTALEAALKGLKTYTDKKVDDGFQTLRASDETALNLLPIENGGKSDDTLYLVGETAPYLLYLWQKTTQTYVQVGGSVGMETEFQDWLTEEILNSIIEHIINDAGFAQSVAESLTVNQEFIANVVSQIFTPADITEIRNAIVQNFLLNNTETVSSLIVNAFLSDNRINSISNLITQQFLTAERITNINSQIVNAFLTGERITEIVNSVVNNATLVQNIANIVIADIAQNDTFISEITQELLISSTFLNNIIAAITLRDATGVVIAAANGVFTLPTATQTRLGFVKGTSNASAGTWGSIAIAADGTMSVNQVVAEERMTQIAATSVNQNIKVQFLGNWLEGTMNANGIITLPIELLDNEPVTPLAGHIYCIKETDAD